MAEYPDSGPPVDGRGGSLWKSNITFPVYPSHSHPHGGPINITWAELDSVFLYNEQTNATAGICFGLCLVAFLNVISLTPKSKRSLPLYTFILIALALLTARYLSLMVLYTDLEVGSAYYNIAADYADGETISSIVGIVFVIWLTPFSFLFVVLCLYVQGKCVLVLLALKHRYLYNGIMSYLVTLSISTAVLRMVTAAFVTVNQFDFNFVLPKEMHTAVLATYTATILSWSLVFSWQVGMINFNRYKLGRPLDKSEGLAILFMTGIESMLIPMIFTILQITNIPWFPNAEYLIMPSIACIIPFGSIWASAANQHASLQRAIQTNTAAAPIRCNNCSEMMFNDFPHDNSTPGNTHPSASASVSSSALSPFPPRSSPRISRFPGQPTQASNPPNDFTLSGAATLNPNSDTNTDTLTDTHTPTNVDIKAPLLSTMPMTSSILGSATEDVLNFSSSPNADNHYSPITCQPNTNEEVPSAQKYKYNTNIKDI